MNNQLLFERHDSMKRIIAKVAVTRSSPREQEGAVLFIALMLLIILTLLGISAAQVTALQERMAAIYRSDRMSFEKAESVLADVERGTTSPSAVNNILCENLYGGTKQVATWMGGLDLATASHVENLGRGAGFTSIAGSIEAGLAQEIGDKDCLFLQISAHGYDDDSTKDSHSIVQSIFTP